MRSWHIVFIIKLQFATRRFGRILRSVRFSEHLAQTVARNIFECREATCVQPVRADVADRQASNDPSAAGVRTLQLLCDVSHRHHLVAPPRHASRDPAWHSRTRLLLGSCTLPATKIEARLAPCPTSALGPRRTADLQRRVRAGGAPRVGHSCMIRGWPPFVQERPRAPCNHRPRVEGAPAAATSCIRKDPVWMMRLLRNPRCALSAMSMSSSGGCTASSQERSLPRAPGRPNGHHPHRHALLSTMPWASENCWLGRPDCSPRGLPSWRTDGVQHLVHGKEGHRPRHYARSVVIPQGDFGRAWW